MNGATLKSYTFGFLASVALTLAAYSLVVNHTLPGWHLVAAVLGLALVQFVVQMLYFLYIGSETGTRWNLGTFVATITLILIIVVGSIWIMSHLNYRMMASPSEVQHYIQDQQGF